MLSNRMGHLCSMARHDHRLFSLAAQGHCLVYLTLWGQRLCSTGWTGQNLSQIKVNSSCLKSLQPSPSGFLVSVLRVLSGSDGLVQALILIFLVALAATHLVSFRPVSIGGLIMTRL